MHAAGQTRAAGGRRAGLNAGSRAYKMEPDTYALGIEIKGPNLSFLRSFSWDSNLASVLRSVYHDETFKVVKIEAAEKQKGSWWQVEEGESIRTLADFNVRHVRFWLEKVTPPTPAKT